MRFATQDDVEDIIAAMKVLYRRSAVQRKYADEGRIRQTLQEKMAVSELWFKGPYLIMVDVGFDWYTNKKFLFEKLVLRVYRDPSYTLDDVPPALQYLKELFDCEAIIAGDTHAGRMTPVYQKHGYTLLGTQLIKE